ncbi:MAG: hypothetical protein DRJ42_22635, partial [Deltaproteobacteria bacterium]
MTVVHRVQQGALLVAIAILAFFSVSGPHAFDTGELVAAAFMLGGSHPPGQPLHAIIGFAATLIPLGPAAFRVSLVSISGAVAAAALAGSFARRIAERLSDSPLPPSISTALPFAAGFAVLIAPPVLRQANRPEVYTLALSLFGVACLSLFDWASSERGKSGSLLAAAFAGGLAASLHPPHGLAAIGVGAAFAVTARRDLFRRPRVLASAAGACLSGLSVLVYLPIRAAAGAPMWGNPTSLAGFFDYVTGAAYQHNLGTGAGTFGDQLMEVARYLPYAAGAVPFFGLYALARFSRGAVVGQRRIVAALLGAAVLAVTGAMVTPIDPVIPDMVAYAGPAVFLVITVGAAGVALLPRPRWALVGLVGIATSLFALEAAPEAVRADAPVLDALGQSLTSAPPPRSLVIVTDDFTASTWTMERAVAGARPDVALFVSGLASSSWHWRTLASHAAFDGTPASGPGRDPWQRFTRGAMQLAAPMVPIVIETDEWSGGQGMLAGPYLVGDGRLRRAVLTGSTSERLAEHIARLAAEGPAGDEGVVHAIYRTYEVRRARRLALRRETGAASLALSRALIDPSPVELAALVAAHGAINPALIAPVVRKPG